MEFLPVLDKYGILVLVAVFIIDKVWPFFVKHHSDKDQKNTKIEERKLEHVLSQEERYFNLLVTITSDVRASISALSTQLEHNRSSLEQDYHTSLSNVNATLLSLQTDLRNAVVYLGRQSSKGEK